MSHRAKKMPSKSKLEDSIQNNAGSKGKRKKSRITTGTKGYSGLNSQLDDSPTTAQFDSSSKTPWTPRYLSDLKNSNIYNRNATEAPAELFRKDLISAMKLPDSEPLGVDDYWSLSDPWRQEWERGVQVPVSPDSLPIPKVTCLSNSLTQERTHDFKLPKNKFVRITHDDFYSPEIHQLTSAPARSQQVCLYDMDDIDLAWLNRINTQRIAMGLSKISELSFEQTMEELERQSWANMQELLKTEELLGIEYDENVICDVCRAPDSEEGNEMVFCDRCNICVHQACYGILSIPPGPWLCKPCSLGLRPPCQLCPNQGGALKATRGGSTWAHVACALWIPEVSIGCVEKMEPITKISSIPASRWGLVCVLCKEKCGACIQCSVKSCKTAYHVTCAFRHNLEMKAIVEDEHSEDGVKLKSYCLKHSVVKKPGGIAGGTNGGEGEDNCPSVRKAKKDMTAEERNLLRAQKLQQIESEFYKYATVSDTAKALDFEVDVIDLIFSYWVLKRKSNRDRPLLVPKTPENERLSLQQQQDLERMKMFVQLRQDLERVRNLCYMVSRREKLSRTYFRLREQTFQKQVAILILSDIQKTLTTSELNAIKQANHAPNIYDSMYSNEVCAKEEFDQAFQLLVNIDNCSNHLRKDHLSDGDKSRQSIKDSQFIQSFVNGVRKARDRSLSSVSSDSPSDSELTSKWSKESASRKAIQLSSSSSDSEMDYMLDTKKIPESKSTARPSKPIYTDSEDELSRHTPSGSIGSAAASIPTKAAVKAFSPVSSSRGRRKKSETSSFKVSTEMIVPQRQAAKKATENFSNTSSSSHTKERKEEKDSKDAGKENLHQRPSKSPVKNLTSSMSSPADLNALDESTDSSVSPKNKNKSPEKPTGFPSYVPQRQAARKAAETIKIGSSKSSSSLFDFTPDATSEPLAKRKLKTDSKPSTVQGKTKSEVKSKSKVGVEETAGLKKEGLQSSKKVKPHSTKDSHGTLNKSSKSKSSEDVSSKPATSAANLSNNSANSKPISKKVPSGKPVDDVKESSPVNTPEKQTPPKKGLKETTLKKNEAPSNTASEISRETTRRSRSRNSSISSSRSRSSSSSSSSSFTSSSSRSSSTSSGSSSSSRNSLSDTDKTSGQAAERKPLVSTHTTDRKLIKSKSSPLLVSSSSAQSSSDSFPSAALVQPASKTEDTKKGKASFEESLGMGSLESIVSSESAKVSESRSASSNGKSPLVNNPEHLRRNKMFDEPESNGLASFDGSCLPSEPSQSDAIISVVPTSLGELKNRAMSKTTRSLNEKDIDSRLLEDQPQKLQEDGNSVRNKEDNSRSRSEMPGVTSRSPTLLNEQPPQKKSKEATDDGDMFDFEHELLDIARSVTENDSSFMKPASLSTNRLFDDYDHVDSAPLSSLNYSFNAEIVPKADNSEDSARETMNLVEKLRMQYASKSTPATSHPEVKEDPIPARAPSPVPTVVVNSVPPLLTGVAVPISETQASGVVTPSPSRSNQRGFPIEHSIPPPNPTFPVPDIKPENVEPHATNPEIADSSQSPQGIHKAAQDPAPAPYFYNVPYSAPFPYPPFFGTFFRPEFLPPYLLPPTLRGSSVDTMGNPQLASLPSQSPGSFPPSTCGLPDTVSPDVSNSNVNAVTPLDNTRNTATEYDSSAFAPTMECPPTACDPKQKYESAEPEHSAIEENGHKEPNPPDDARMGSVSLPGPTSLHEITAVQEGIRDNGLGLISQNQTFVPTINKRTPTTSKVSAAAIEEEFKHQDVPDPGAPLLLNETTPQRLSSTSPRVDRRQRPSRSSLTPKSGGDPVSADSDTATFLGNDFNAATPLTAASKSKPAGKNKANRAPRPRGHPAAKKGSVGLFEPKIISALSSQDLAGTVYDFDDFGDDFDAAESIKAPVSCKTTRRVDIQLNKSPRPKSLAKTESNISSSRGKKKSLSEQNTENVGSETLLKLPADHEAHEKESAVPPLTVPPVKLTLARFNSSLSQSDPSATVTIASDAARSLREPCSIVELKESIDRKGRVDDTASHEVLNASVTCTLPVQGTIQTTEALTSRQTSIGGPSDKAMQDLEALDRAIESALAGKASVSDPASHGTSADNVTSSETTATGSADCMLGSSRHALKFKIKGPFLDASYSSSNTSSMPLSFSNTSATSTPSADSSNLRRMRKKELIRQYVSQDTTSIPQQSHNTSFHFPFSSAVAYANEEYLLAGSDDFNDVGTKAGGLPEQATNSSTNKSHISIPKAVASFGSAFGSFEIVDDQTNISNDSREGKKKKRGSNSSRPLSRELRNLQIIAGNEDPSQGADASNNADRRKDRRRRRNQTQSNDDESKIETTELNAYGMAGEPSHQLAPKLKIRFREKPGSGEIVTVCNPNSTAQQETDAKKASFRPPKKRIADAGSNNVQSSGSNDSRAENNPPLLEELWRQSMKFREEVMADFSKSERRRNQGAVEEESNELKNFSKSESSCGLDSKPEFKNKRHKTKTRKDRSKSKDRDGNNRRRPPVASTDLVSIAGGGPEEITAASTDANGRKRKRTANTQGNQVDDRSLAEDVDDPLTRKEGPLGPPPKLIIRLGKKVDSSKDNALRVPNPDEPMCDIRPSAEDVTPPPPLEKPDSESISSTDTSLRIMPIKLKLARCSQGSYVTKTKSDSTPPPSPNATAKEGYEVR